MNDNLLFNFVNLNSRDSTTSYYIILFLLLLLMLSLLSDNTYLAVNSKEEKGRHSIMVYT